MPDFQFMNANELASRMGEDGLQIIDIRDRGSYDSGHIHGARHIDDDNAKAFIDSADQQAPLVVCCYHGNSSQGAAQFLAAQGFEQAYSLDGGFEMWRTLHPEYVER